MAGYSIPNTHEFDLREMVVDSLTKDYHVPVGLCTWKQEWKLLISEIQI